MYNGFKTISERLEIVKYDVNDIIFTIWIRDNLIPNNSEILNYNIVKDNLRSWVLELGDALKFIGVTVPIIIIVEYFEDTDDTWHEIAGDQDWHRGDFAIIPCKNSNDAGEMFEDVSKKAFNFDKYTIHPVSSDQISQYLYDEINRILSSNKIEQKLHVTIIKNIADCLKNDEDTEKAFNLWKSEIEKSINSISSGGKNNE